MQSFVILCNSSQVWRTSTDTEAGSLDRTSAMLNASVISTSAFLGWFNPAEAYQAFLQEQKFDSIVAELKIVVWIFDRGSMIYITFD